MNIFAYVNKYSATISSFKTNSKSSEPNSHVPVTSMVNHYQGLKA